VWWGVGGAGVVVGVGVLRGVGRDVVEGGSSSSCA